MKEDLTDFELRALAQDIEYGLGMMASLAAKNPTAKITFNIATKRVSVTFALPKDSVKIKAFVCRDYPDYGDI
jgi:hypothetical protein